MRAILACALLASSIVSIAPASETALPFDAKTWKLSGDAKIETYLGRTALRARRGAAVAEGVSFQDGTVEQLREAKGRGDISIEDLKEVFYISYEMAAHRFTNLATKHLELPVHFLRTDPEGVVQKAYENDGIAFPMDTDGGLEGERVSRHWGARQALPELTRKPP